MSKFENYLKRFDIAANVTDEELEKTQALASQQSRSGGVRS